MSQISVNGLTFCYEGSFDNIFEDAPLIPRITLCTKMICVSREQCYRNGKSK